MTALTTATAVILLLIAIIWAVEAYAKMRANAWETRKQEIRDEMRAEHVRRRMAEQRRPDRDIADQCEDLAFELEVYGSDIVDVVHLWEGLDD